LFHTHASFEAIPKRKPFAIINIPALFFCLCAQLQMWALTFLIFLTESRLLLQRQQRARFLALADV
jgi:hypothetical protein